MDTGQRNQKEIELFPKTRLNPLIPQINLPTHCRRPTNGLTIQIIILLVHVHAELLIGTVVATSRASKKRISNITILSKNRQQ